MIGGVPRSFCAWRYLGTANNKRALFMFVKTLDALASSEFDHLVKHGQWATGTWAWDRLLVVEKTLNGCLLAAMIWPATQASNVWVLCACGSSRVYGAIVVALPEAGSDCKHNQQGDGSPSFI